MTRNPKTQKAPKAPKAQEAVKRVQKSSKSRKNPKAGGETEDRRARKTQKEDTDQIEEEIESRESEPVEDSTTSTNSDDLVVRRAHLIGSKVCLIRRTPDESLDVYHRRVGYISKKKSDNPNTDISDAANNSIIWRNHEIYGMGYPSTVLRRL